MSYKSLYEVIYKDDTTIKIKLSNETHEVFKAHFPDKPILPGFIHFEIIEDIFNLEITSIKRAKFTEAVLPEQTLEYVRENNKFKVFCNEKIVARFSI